jgi:hypothetical protein
MGVKVLHFLDRVFQEFATDLSRYAGQDNPLRAASSSLRGRQRSTVIMTLGPLRYGVKPTISLPPGLVSGQRIGSNPESAQQGSTEGGGEATGASNEPRMKSVTLPEGWRIPRGNRSENFSILVSMRLGQISRDGLRPHTTGREPKSRCASD